MDRSELYLLRRRGAMDAREEAADSSHSDITEADLGEVPGVDLATLRWAMAQCAGDARRQRDLDRAE